MRLRPTTNEPRDTRRSTSSRRAEHSGDDARKARLTPIAADVGGPPGIVVDRETEWLFLARETDAPAERATAA